VVKDAVNKESPWKQAGACFAAPKHLVENYAAIFSVGIQLKSLERRHCIIRSLNKSRVMIIDMGYQHIGNVQDEPFCTVALCCAKVPLRF
jgi:hypothetical protein